MTTASQLCGPNCQELRRHYMFVFVFPPVVDLTRKISLLRRLPIRPYLLLANTKQTLVVHICMDAAFKVAQTLIPQTLIRPTAVCFGFTLLYTQIRAETHVIFIYCRNICFSKLKERTRNHVKICPISVLIHDIMKQLLTVGLWECV